MNTRIASVSLAVLTIAAGLAAADNPFAGKWKLNVGKSNFTGQTMKFEPAAGGAIRFSAIGMSYTFKADGKEYPAFFGYTAEWKEAGKNTWETINRLNGKVINTEVTTVSPDGKTLTVTTSGTKPSGEPFKDTTTYERVSGQSGLVGAWKSKEVKISSPNILEFTAFDTDGMAVSVPDYKVMCKAKLDGKDYPAAGPTVPAGLTLTLRRTGPRAFEMAEKQNGKPMFRSTYTLSGDGRTLTAVEKPVATNESITAVYDRQ